MRRWITVIKLTGRKANHLSRRDQLGKHVGDLKLRVLKLGNRAIELLSIFHISSGIDNGLLRRAHRAGCDIDSTTIQPFHGNGEALTLSTQSIGYRDVNIIKADLPRGLRIPTHLALILAVGDSLEISGH